MTTKDTVHFWGLMLMSALVRDEYIILSAIYCGVAVLLFTASLFDKEEE